MNPIIGIAVCGFTEEKQFVSHSYIHAIEYSGGYPVILPCTGIIPDHNFLDFCDGFLFCGGGDITPLLMGEDPAPENGPTDISMDLFHLALIRYALASGKPILAICRGMQLLNIAMGGSIYQDASLYPHPGIGHMQNSRKRGDPSHKILIKKPSILYNIFGKYTVSNSYHHQYIKCPATHLIPTGHTSDHVIEALEADNHPFTVGVQWHPECMYDTACEMRCLFHHFIGSCICR